MPFEYRACMYREIVFIKSIPACITNGSQEKLSRGRNTKQRLKKFGTPGHGTDIVQRKSNSPSATMMLDHNESATHEVATVAT